jgi:hypothetical protein
MFEDHLLDLFGDEITAWLDANGITVAFTSWADEDTELEDAGLAFEFLHMPSGGRAVICGQGQLRENVDFPQEFLDHLSAQASS